MARYEVPTPSTLLLRVVTPERAAAALRMLDEALPGSPPSGNFQVATLSDVSSDSSSAPLAACLVGHESGAPTAWIARFAVSVPFRRRGLGRRLLVDLSRALQAAGAQSLWVHASDGPATRALLASGGFVILPAPGAPPLPADLPSGQDEPEAVWWVREL